MTPKNKLPNMGMPGMGMDPNTTKKAFHNGLKQGFLIGFAIGIILLELIIHVWILVPK